MKKVVAVLCLGVVGLCGFAQAADHAGKALFDAKCASCHGKTLKGNPALAKTLKIDAALLDLTATADKSTDDLLKVTNEGHGKMPAYKAKLKAEEIQNLIGYIRSIIPEKKSADAK